MQTTPQPFRFEQTAVVSKLEMYLTHSGKITLHNFCHVTLLASLPTLPLQSVNERASQECKLNHLY